jgi:uncharacterized damage-inducible protein DinB
MTERRSLVVSALPGYEAEIGRWMWALEDVRRTVKARLNGISQSVIDTKIDGRDSIATLLYHIALVEADWLYEEVLVSDWAPEIRALFPFGSRDSAGDLTHVEGQSLDAHFHRLDSVRKVFLSHFQTMDIADWRNPRSLPAYDVTPEWVVYHLIEHESHHRGQIFQSLGQLQKR